MIAAVLRTMLVLCLVSSVAARSEEPPDRPDRGQGLPAPRRSPASVTTPEPNAVRETGRSAESTAKIT